MFDDPPGKECQGNIDDKHEWQVCLRGRRDAHGVRGRIGDGTTHINPSLNDYYIARSQHMA